MNLTFLGATGRVTGSLYYLEHAGLKFLIDCGQFQGSLSEEQHNFDTLPFQVSKLDFIILTHAHVDHSGRLPLLVKRGFKGKVFCTYPTKELAEILLKDSGKIQEADNAIENKKRQRAGLETEPPLFTEDDAIEALQYLYPLNYETSFSLADGLSFRYVDAGHLLGSASVLIDFDDHGLSRRLTFSGDLGNSTNPVQKPPTPVDHTDYLVMESTYGDRNHEHVETRISRLVDIILKAYHANGTVIIPSFAVGRTQELIFQLNLYLQTAVPEVVDILQQMPFYVDSPMALKAFEVYENHKAAMSETVQSFEGNPFSMPNLHLVEGIEMSIALNRDPKAKVIIAASGMCDAGRIQHHLKHYLWKTNTHLVFIGYQAEETLGRQLLDGIKSIKLFNDTIAVKANIHVIDGFSGHADQNHLLSWAQKIKGIQKLFIIHGEPAASDVLAEVLSERLSDKPEIVIPAPGETYGLSEPIEH